MIRRLASLRIAARCRSVAHRCARIASRRRRDPARRAQLRLRLHGARDPRDAGRRHRQSRHAVGARRRGAVERARPARPASPAPTATAMRAASMKGVAARYPAFDAARGRPVNLEQRINMCRTRAPAGARRSPTRAGSCWRSPPIVGAAVARQPIAVADDPRRAAVHRDRPRRFHRAGRASSISPARNATTTTGASGSPAAPIPQAHPTGYPIYRLEWQSLGSLQRRLRNCIIGMRAEPYAARRAGTMSSSSSI